MIPEDVLEMIPLACRGSDDAEFETATNCAASKFLECKGLIDVLGNFEDLLLVAAAADGGNSTDVTVAGSVADCFDVEESFCSIASECPPCEDEFDVLTRCIVQESEDVMDNNNNATELVNSCTLTCIGE